MLLSVLGISIAILKHLINDWASKLQMSTSYELIGQFLHERPLPVSHITLTTADLGHISADGRLTSNIKRQQIVREM